MALGWIADRLRSALPVLRPAPAEAAVGIRIVGDATMARLHDRHLGDPTTTDVLTFAAADVDHAGADARSDDGAGARMDRSSGDRLRVDLVLCLDEARRQAGARGHRIEQELLLYAIHGLLHCRGHDDHSEADAAAMHAEEDRILEAIGVGAVFARPELEPTGPSAVGGQSGVGR